MVHACSPKVCSPTVRRAQLLFLAVLLAVGLRTGISNADITVHPGPRGHLGIWLVAGPLFGSEPNLRFASANNPNPTTATTDKVVEIAHGADVLPKQVFSVLQAPSGRYDLRKTLRSQANTYALFAGVLRATTQTRAVLILGTNDGVRVTVDDRVVFDKDLRRPPLHDDDAVAFDLSPGAHPLLIRLRHRSGDWQFAARLLEASDLRPSHTVHLVLPGVEPQHVDATQLTEASFRLASFADRYEPMVRITATGGLPLNTRLPITAKAVVHPGTPRESIVFQVALGHMPVGNTSVHDVEARLPAIDAALLENNNEETPFALHASVGNHATSSQRRGHPTVRRALGAIDEALALARAETSSRDDSRVVLSSLELSRTRLGDFLSSGDTDLSATVQEATRSEAFARSLIDGKDPLFEIQGAHRLAYRSPLDGNNRPFGVYVPSSLTQGKTYPLVVALHGLNGLPMQMIHVFFGKERSGVRAPSEDRRFPSLPALPAFVVAPSGFGNISYREFGEVDVMHLVRWMKQTYPIDEDRVYVTGLSMGGTGAGAIGLRYPDEFAAAVPLCGYHSYSLRSDMAYRELRSWEKALASYWSNVSWAERGKHLPLFVVHGTQDKPVQNSSMLVDRYNDLRYPILSETPNAGHNVWHRTYAGSKAYRWMTQHRREHAPSEVVLTTPSLRYADRAWVHIQGIEQHLVWSKVRARILGDQLEVQTSGVTEVAFDPPSHLMASGSISTVVIDGQSLEFDRGSPLVMHREAGAWTSGSASKQGIHKRAGLSGPIRDAFVGPLVFVVGTQDPALTAANAHVAHALAAPPYGVEARWPVIADVDLDDTVASTHALFLVGSERSNSYVGRIAEHLPFRLEARAVVAGTHRFEGNELGVQFIFPNPLHPNRYVVVLASGDVSGTLRALSLPRMLPDFVVYDERVAGARGQTVLGNAAVLAGGMFGQRWELPSSLVDPVDAKRIR